MAPLVRPYAATDAIAVLALAGELTAGVASWRAPDAVESAVRRWVADAVEAADPYHPVWVAELDGEVIGFVAARTSAHWAGELDAFVGELVVAPEARGQGVARLLLAQVERWARERGLAHVRVATGAANGPARALYAAAGYAEEDVVVTKTLTPGPEETKDT